MNKTVEQIEEELAAIGVDIGSWGTTNGGTTVMPSVVKQVSALVGIVNVLEGAAAKDRETLDLLHEQLAMLERGGGKR